MADGEVAFAEVNKEGANVAVGGGCVGAPVLDSLTTKCASATAGSNREKDIAVAPQRGDGDPGADVLDTVWIRVLREFWSFSE